MRLLVSCLRTSFAFGRRCIPAGYVAPPSNIPDILGRRALPAGRLACLGATLDFHHGLLTLTPVAVAIWRRHHSSGRAATLLVTSTVMELIEWLGRQARSARSSASTAIRFPPSAPANARLCNGTWVAPGAAVR